MSPGSFCEYHGGMQSRIQVNVDLPLSALEVLTVAIHETYPGHHAERCWKELLLVRDQERLEETIVLVPTPQSLVAEGIAKVAPPLLLEGLAPRSSRRSPATRASTSISTMRSPSSALMHRAGGRR
jgi:hypothetical protein